ncbi:MAG: hypothetical protein E5X41_30360 [Mesorhizobium sp.]|nr:MAG: hypothetical protein E5X41_30360 [Mesorhizobium sp.]
MLEPGYEGDSELTFALQSEFHKGFPLENLRPLLMSGNLHTQAAAAFLVAEISPRLSFNMNCVSRRSPTCSTARLLGSGSMQSKRFWDARRRRMEPFSAVSCCGWTTNMPVFDGG